MRCKRGTEASHLVWLVLLALVAVPLAGLASTRVEIVVSNTQCAHLQTTQFVFLRGGALVHMGFKLPGTVPMGQSQTFDFEVPQVPTEVRIGGTRDGQSFQVTVPAPGLTPFACGSIEVSVDGAAPVGAVSAQLTRWAIPTANARPQGMGIAPDGKVYFAEFGAGKIAQLDPSTNEIRERSVSGAPYGLYVSPGGSLFYTLPQENAVEIMVFTGGTGGWELPTAHSSPGALVSAPTGPGQVNLWIAERNAGRVARLAPSQISVTLPLIITPPTTVLPSTSQIPGHPTSVAPELHSGNPMLPPPIALLEPIEAPPFTEWGGHGWGSTVQRVAVAPDGRVWFTEGRATLTVLDPSSNTALYHGLPSGTQALAITVGPNGWVWFTDTSRPAVGVLDPVTDDVRLWSIPGGSEPFDLVHDSTGRVWFTDRGGNAIGCLNLTANQIVMYPLGGNTQPAFLVLDQQERLWFTAERGNYVGRLSLAPVLGPPPLPLGAGAFAVTSVHVRLSGPAHGRWKSGQLTLGYTYDGGGGFPIWVSVELLSGGAVVPGFAVSPAQVNSPGSGSAVVEVIYQGAATVTTNQVRVLASRTQGGAPFVESVLHVGPITWSP